MINKNKKSLLVWRLTIFIKAFMCINAYVLKLPFKNYREQIYKPHKKISFINL